MIYTIPKDTKLGGPYGTTITFNASRIHGIKKYWTTDPDMGYTSKLFGFDKLYFQDINLDITRKFSKKFKAGINYFYFMYDEDLFTQLTGFKSTSDVKAHVAVVEMSYKFNKKHNLRWELQHCYTKQEFGSWAMALVEYTLSPHLFVAVFDEYNYGNAEPDKRLHYYTANAGVNYGNFRVTGGYGRQRAGVLCVGGVCRVVPASNGFTLSVSGTF